VLTLSYQGDDGKPVTHELKTGETIIGRAPTCGIVINHPSVSRQHARLTVTASGVRLVDLGSTFGTSRAGVALGAEADVLPGDRLTIGRVDVTVHGPAAKPELTLSDDHRILDASATVRRPVAVEAGAAGAGGAAADVSPRSDGRWWPPNRCRSCSGGWSIWCSSRWPPNGCSC
jgi:pSer/pThr/pTyr-binding forkhead associated (FHA) protein